MKFLLLTILLLCLSISTAAQDDDDESVPTLPDEVMRHVVNRMASYYFKPARRPRTIYFSDENLKQEWLPQIANIRFVVLKSNDITLGTIGYVFTIQDRKDNLYSIGFGYGEIGCSGGGSGVIWSLRLTGKVIKLWPRKGSGFGWACDADAAPVANKKENGTGSKNRISIKDRRPSDWRVFVG